MQYHERTRVEAELISLRKKHEAALNSNTQGEQHWSHCIPGILGQNFLQQLAPARTMATACI